jgi:formiminotetrahydrofolate cyclodeaminase
MDTVTAFLRVLDSHDASTGGGTASALAGAMAAALAAMVARLSIGKGLGAPDAFYEELSVDGERLSLALAAGGVRDAEAFDAVKAAYRLPKDTAEQKAARAAAIQAAMIAAAQTPLENAARCAIVEELVVQLGERSNPATRSDLQCAGHLARAALAGCLANVAINLPAIKDQATASAIRERARALRAVAGLDESTETP